MAQYKRIEQSTIKRYMKGAVDGITEMKPEWALLKKKGKISRGNHGKSLEWVVRGGKHSIAGRNDFEVIEFDRKNHLDRAASDWAEYIVTDAMSDGEKLMNSGPEALVKEHAGLLKRLRENMMEGLAAKFITEDENDTSLTYNPLAGIATWKEGTWSSGKEATPNDTYAGLSTAPSAATDIDSADQVSDFWSPLLVAWNKDVWGNSAATVAANILDAMKYAKVYREFSQDQKHKIDLFLFSQTDYLNFLDKYEDKTEIQVVGAAKELVDIGFQAVNYFGVPVTWSENVSSGEGYGLNYDFCELCVLGDEDFDAKASYSDDRAGDVYRVIFRGQLKWQPRYQVVLDSF